MKIGKVLLAVAYLGIGWSATVYGSPWVGKALLSTHPQQRISSFLDFSFVGGLGINRKNFSYQIGKKVGINTATNDKLLSLHAYIIKHDDGEYSVTILDRKNPVGGSYTPNEDESIAVLEYRDRNDSLVNVTMSFTREPPAPNRQRSWLKLPKKGHIISIEIEGTVTPPDGQQIITFSDKLTRLPQYIED